LEIRPSVATYQPREGRRHNVVDQNRSIPSSNGGHANTCHSVLSSEMNDGERGVTYSVVKRSGKVVYSSNQQPRRLDKLAAIEASSMLPQNQPRCQFCFKYPMSDRVKDEHEKKWHPAGRTPRCDWENSGCDKRIQNSNHRFNHLRLEHEMQPFPRFKLTPLWRSSRISGGVLQLCTICGDDFLDLSHHTKCSPCGSDYYCPVCNLRFNDSRKSDDYTKRHDVHREMTHCPEKDCNKPFATRQGLDEHI